MLKVVILITASILQWHSLPALAAGSCMSDKSDIREDTKVISDKLTVKYGFSPILDTSSKIDPNYKAKDIDKIYDAQELKVDRSLPFLDQLNAVGVITDAPLGKQKGYATAVLISPCHVLVNAH